MSELIFRSTQVNCDVICWWVKAVLFIAHGTIYTKIYLHVIDMLPHVWDRRCVAMCDDMVNGFPTSLILDLTSMGNKEI